jgi:putative DNA primase/helicase
MIALETLLSKLDRVHRNGNGSVMARCPCHDDSTASLSIRVSETSGNLILHCHAGCQNGDIADKLGYTMADLMADKKGKQPGTAIIRRLTAHYDYTDVRGTLLYQSLRYEPKTFTQRRPDGNSGWITNMDGVDRVLFNLPRVLRADTVYVVEGEKDALNLGKLGLVATTNVGGASAKWLDSYTEALRGRDIIILPDNDLPGRKHAENVAQAMLTSALRVRVLALPNLPIHGDASDWIAAGGTREQLDALADACPEWTPDTQAEEEAEEEEEKQPAVTVTLLTDAEIISSEPPPVHWVVDGLIPEGGICLIAGDSGVGKSWLVIHTAQCVASGVPFLGHFEVSTNPVLLIDSEHGDALLRRRYTQLRRGMDFDVTTPIPVTLAPVGFRVDVAATQWLVERIEETGARLVIMDPLADFFTGNENDSSDMSAFFEQIRQIRNATGAAFLFAHHVRKQSNMASSAPGQMLRGSSAIRAVLDSYIYTQRVNDVVLCTHDKCRPAEIVKSWTVEITDTIPQHTTVLTYTQAQDETTQRDIAMAIILDIIAENGGTCSRKDIADRCKTEGVAERTVKRALAALTETDRVTTRKEGRQSVYMLTIGTDEEDGMVF